MPENLTMRRTVIGGDTLHDDYCVMAEGRAIGRIRLASERSWQGSLWVWAINVPLPIPAWGNGDAGSLEEAKTRFRAAWERFRTGLTDHDIQHWHHHQEAAAERSGTKRRSPD
jgi:hypothetical protein